MMMILPAVLGIEQITSIVPSPDPLGYPVPVWIIRALAYLTLTLHLSAVHFTVGSALLFLWLRLIRRDTHDGALRFLGSGLPLGLSYVITFGIPPLLFAQVLYGQYFYSSSVLIGAFWIQVIPAVILAYAGFYYHKLCRNRRPGGQTLVIGVCTLLLLYVGIIYVSNFTLAVSPDKWASMYAASPGGGRLSHGEPTLHSRLALVLSSALGVSGLGLIWRGVFLERWGMSAVGHASRMLGFRALLVTAILWITIVVWMAFADSWESQRDLAETGNARIILIVWMLAAVAGLVLGYMATQGRGLMLPILASLSIVGTTACLVILRDLVRIGQLAPAWDTSLVPVRAQWGMFSMFLVTLVIGGGLIIFLLVKVVPGLAGSARGEDGTSVVAESV